MHSTHYWVLCTRLGFGSMTFDWRAIANCVWDNKTLPEACELLGYDWDAVYGEMRDARFRRLYVDISMVASVREEMIEEMNDAGTTDNRQQR